MKVLGLFSWLPFTLGLSSFEVVEVFVADLLSTLFSTFSFCCLELLDILSNVAGKPKAKGLTVDISFGSLEL